MKLELEQWRDLVRQIYEVHALEPHATASVDIEITTDKGMLLSEVKEPKQLLIHDPSMRRDVCHDYLLFEVFYSGGGRAEVGDVGCSVGPTRMHLIDMSQRYVSLKGRSHSRGVCIPHEEIGYLPGEEPAFASLNINSPTGRLLRATHAELVSQQSGGSDHDTVLVRRTFVDLVRRFMLGPAQRVHNAPERDLPVQFLMRDHVATHLDHPDLDVDSLAAAFGVSRATLYRQFDSDGGVTRYIRNRRLDRCFSDLAGAKPERGKIAGVARQWHFNDATHFNRLFRERFGISPSQCLQKEKQRTAAAPSDQIQIAQDWFAQMQTH